MVQKIATLDEFNKVLEDAKTAGKLVVVDFTASKLAKKAEHLPRCLWDSKSI